jgi:hypothetical protein
MKSNKHTFNFKNQVIHIENSKKFSRFTALKYLLTQKNLYYGNTKIYEYNRNTT